MVILYRPDHIQDRFCRDSTIGVVIYAGQKFMQYWYILIIGGVSHLCAKIYIGF